MKDFIARRGKTLVMICLLLGALQACPVLDDDDGDPKPVNISRLVPPELPAVWDQVRAGHWVHGVNMPWDNYGTDFGSNSWGYRGLASQGPSGWRFENRIPDDGARRLIWAERSKGDHCLGVKVKLRGVDHNSLVFLQFDEKADKPDGFTLDLSSRKIRADFYFPSGIEGPDKAPTGVMFYFQDQDWNWAQSSWKNIKWTDRWITLKASMDEIESDIGFDVTKVRRVGVKVGTNSRAAGFNYKGCFYIDNVSVSNEPEIKFAFSRSDTHTEREMKDLAGLEVKTLRWWVFGDGRAGLIFDDDGFVTGLDPRFLSDVDEMIRLAESTGMYLTPVLFDFLLGAKPAPTDGVTLGGHAALITDAAKRQSLLDNAVAPLFDKLAPSSAVLMIDLINEPEWLILDSDITMPAGKRPDSVQAGGVVSLADMKQFLNDLIALSKSKGMDGKQLLTVGSASPGWVTLWGDLELDIAQFHLWNGAGQIDDGKILDFAPPVSGLPNFIGEVSTLPEMQIQDTCELLEAARQLGYVGLFPWAYRAKDNASSPLLGQDSRDCIHQFAVDHPELVGF